MSIFSEALRSLLDETDLYSRKEWALLLSVPVTRLEEWLDDTQLPRPHALSMIWITLEHSSDVRKEGLVPFLEMSKMYAMDVSPHGNRMLPTVWRYMKRRIFCPLSSQLAKLEPEEQGELLERMFPRPPFNELSIV